MQFIDLQTQYQLHKTQIDAAIARVLSHGQFLFGPEVQMLEEELANYVGVKHCIAMSSGTTALHIALMALNIQPGDEVITTPFSFFATAEVIYLLGAKPIYVDIDPQTYLLNPALLESVITSKTKAIIPVGLYGQCVDMDAINAIAKKYSVPVISSYNSSVYAQYTVQVDDRETIQKLLSEKNIPTVVHYPCGLHQQPISLQENIEKKLSFPVTELCAKRVLSLPFHPYMQEETVKIICEELKSCCVAIP